MPLSNKQKKFIQKHHKRQSIRQIVDTLSVPEQEVAAYIETLTPKPFSRKKKIIFSLITAAIPILFFVLLETGLRITDYRGNLDLFVFPERYDGKYAMVNGAYHERYFFNTEVLSGTTGDYFLVEKPENGFRVFVLGASTTVGFPYNNTGRFSLVLEDMLSDVLPDKHVEVVNLGMTATNTYTVYDQTREILKYQPDAVVIYSGQNEYFGALGVGSAESIGQFPGFVRFYLNFQDYKTFLWMRDVMVSASNMIGGLLGSGSNEMQTGTLMERIVSESSIPLDSRLYEMGKRQYESNLNAILSIYSKQNIPVFLSSLASNLKDHPPFYSQATDQHPPADEVFQRAADAYASGDSISALEQYQYARDLDVIRFRAPTAFNDIIREQSQKHNAHYVPVKESLSEASEQSIIGFEVMLEHLHPNSTGYFLMGKTIFKTMLDAEIPNFEPDITLLRDWDSYKEMMYLTELDHAIAWHRVEGLRNNWPFIDEPDPQGYPANFTPENKIDSLAVDFNRQQIIWFQAKTYAAQWYMDHGDYENAIQELRGVMRVRPFDHEPFENAARIARDAGDDELAMEFLSKAYDIKPTSWVCRTKANILFKQGEFERSAVLYMESWELDPDHIMSLYNAVISYTRGNQLQEAMQNADKLYQMNPDYQNIRGVRRHIQDMIDQ